MRRKKQLPVWGIAAVLFLGTLLFTAAALLLQPGSFPALLRGFWQEKLLILLNLLPVLLLAALLWFLCGNPFYALAGAGGVVCLLSYVNLIKTECRNDPLVPADLTLLREALTATREYALDLHWGSLAAILLFCAAVAFAGLFFRFPRPKWPLRAAGAVGVSLVFVLSMSTLYTDTALYARLSPDVDKANVPLTYQRCGFPYCFLANYGRYAVEKPEDYFPEELAARGDAKVYTQPEIQPNVVLVMCEAFTDLSEADAFAYSEAEDPLLGFRQVAASGRAVTGRLVVSNFGAGTANTEFDVLTGIQTELLGVNSSFRTVYRRLNSLPRAFARAGYSTYFLHPGYSWFYNRESVYAYLGIDDCVFEDAFSESSRKGTMISDAAFLDRLISDLDERFAEEAPVFAFGVTIQNHQSYTYEKYGFVPPEVPVNAALSAQEEETLRIYMEGIRDSSDMLLRLTEYLDSVEEPTLLVFWGDHRPALLEDYGVYRALGLRMEGLEPFQTPYLIWANQSYATRCGLPSPELPGCLSANYLGAVVYELVNLTGLDPYFDELESLRRKLPVAAHGQYILEDGSQVPALTPSQENLLHRLKVWGYYRLQDEALIE